MKRNESGKEVDAIQPNAILFPMFCTCSIFRGFHGDKLVHSVERCSRQCLSSETGSAPISTTCCLRALTGWELGGFCDLQVPLPPVTVTEEK